MKEKRAASLTSLILAGICAVIWTVRAILEIIFQTYRSSVFWFVLNLLCAVLWIVSFLVNFKRYRSSSGS